MFLIYFHLYACVLAHHFQNTGKFIKSYDYLCTFYRGLSWSILVHRRFIYKDKGKQQITERPITPAFYISEKHSNGFASLKLNVVPFVKWYLHTFTASLNTKWSKMSAASAQSKLKCQRVMRDSKCYYISEGMGNISSQVPFNLCLTVVLHFVHAILLENSPFVMLVLLICTCKLLTSVVVNRELTETFIVAINS